LSITAHSGSFAICPIARGAASEATAVFTEQFAEQLAAFSGAQSLCCNGYSRPSSKRARITYERRPIRIDLDHDPKAENLQMCIERYCPIAFCRPRSQQFASVAAR
jgi:hypothetical protein